MGDVVNLNRFRKAKAKAAAQDKAAENRALGPGVAASAIPVGIYQGAFTAVGFGLGGVMPDYQIAAMTAVGGLLLVGVSLRLLQLKALPVGDMLPALAFAPVVAWLATRF